MRAYKKITNTARTLLLIVIAYLGVIQGAQAATTVSGPITSNATWALAQSPYQVIADVSVENSATLTIEAGVVISFDTAKNLTISNGALIARGTAGQPIIFTSSLDITGGSPAPGDWGQLRFLGATNDNTTLLEHAQIRYGQGISVTAASPTFNYLLLSNNSGPAISIDLNSSPKGIGNQATGNTLNGINVPPGDLLGTVTWGIKGIPYVVSGGVVSVGITPAISSLSISEIQQGETINATINGSRLTGAQSVAISRAGTTATVQSGATDASVPIQMTASPSAELGAADIALQVAAGRPTQSGALQVIQPQPTVTGLSPNSVYAVQAGNALTVNGKNFVVASVIRLDGADLTTSFISVNSLGTTLPVLAPGNKSITVIQPDPLLNGSFIISKPALLSVTIPPLTIGPASVSQTQGVPFDLTVAMPFAAPPGGTTVNLASNATGIATVPASVTIAEGATTATVPVTTVGLGIATITASKTDFTSASAQVQVLAIPSLSVTSTKLVDVVGNNFSLTINSSSIAGTGGLTVSLSSSDVNVATVTPTVSIPAGTKTVNVQAAAVAIGNATITAIANGFVAGSAAVTVRPVTQSVSVSPLPVAIPPDNVPRKITLKLAAVDAIDHVFSVSVANATIATVGAASITIPAGQTSVQLFVTGLKEGSTSISLVSPILGTVVVPVYVTVEYAGINMSYAPLVGVVKESSAPVVPPNISFLSSPSVGLAFGHYITGMSPNLLTIGTGPDVVTINGEGLQNVTTVNITPGDGLTVDPFTVSTDGKSLSVPVTVAANAPTTFRQVVVSSATGRYKATSPNADRLLISLPLPEVASIDPLFAVPGDIVTLVVRGRNLQNALPITVTPADGIVLASSAPSVNADGTQLTTTVSIDAFALHGPRIIQANTPAGTSDGIASSSNTLTLVSQVQDTITPVVSSLIGLVKETAVPPPANQSYALYSTTLGIAKGATVTGVTPSAGAIGDTITMTITGNELQAVTAVQFNPNTGLTVDTPLVAADGKSLIVNVAVDAAAPLGVRTLKVLAGSTALPFSKAGAAAFNVILPLANITSVEPIVVAIPSSSFTLALNGSNFQNASAIRFTPDADMTIANPPAVNASGTRVTVSISVAATAAAGNRVVSIVTPAGESLLDATVANTVYLTNTPGNSYGPLTSPLVGLIKETVATPPATTQITPVATPIVGVVLEPEAVPPPPVNMNVFRPSPLVGVLYGTVAYTLVPEGLLAGNSDALTVTGIGLDAVTGASVSPATGVTLGALQVSLDGTQLSIPVSVAVDAAVGYRWLVLNRAGGAVSFAQPGANSFWIAADLPALDSVTPNLGQQGTALSSFTIRGTNLQNASAVVAEPADGITFGVPSVDASGTVLTVGMVIDANAPATARLIRVSTHGVMSSAVAVPANTFTVYP